MEVGLTLDNASDIGLNHIKDYVESTTTLVFNSSDDLLEEQYIPFSTRPETYIVPVVFAIIFVVGVLGNGTLILVFLRHRAMRNVPNTYILSLALADLLVIITCVPFTSLVYTVESWPWGEPMCILSETSKDVSIGVSVFTLTALSADRFFAIVDPLRKLHAAGCGRRATRFTIITAALIWVLAMLCAAPAMSSTHVRVIEITPTKQFSVCYPFPQEWGEEYARTMVLLRFLVYYAVPLALIAVFYALMARHLVLSARNVPGELRGAQRQVRARRKVAITVLAFVFIFALCFLPYHISMMWFYYSPNAIENYNTFWHIFRIVGFCLSFMNSCVNPVALYCVSGTFRKHFNRYLLCKSGSSRDLGASRHAASLSLTNSRRNYTHVSTRRHIATSIRRGAPETSVTILGNGNTPLYNNNDIVCSEM